MFCGTVYATDPDVDVKINGQDGTVYVTQGYDVEVTWQLVGNDWEDVICDWWHFTQYEDLYFYYWDGLGKELTNWHYWIASFRTCGVPEFTPVTTSIDTTALFPGTYLFYMGVDDSPDFLLNGNIVYDSGTLVVEAP